MSIFLTLILFWGVTLIFFYRDMFNPFWPGLMSFWSFVFFCYEVYIGNYITSLLWLAGAIIWIGTRKKVIKAKKILDDNKKGNR